MKLHGRVQKTVTALSSVKCVLEPFSNKVVSLNWPMVK